MLGDPNCDHCRAGTKHRVHEHTTAAGSHFQWRGHYERPKDKPYMTASDAVKVTLLSGIAWALLALALWALFLR